MLNTYSSERGNAIFFILIGVALFAALSMAISYSGSSTGNVQISEDKAKVLASELMEYADKVSKGISKLRLRGCRLAEISFENNIITGDYVNGSAPSSEKCHLFSISGAALNWPDLSPDMFNQSWSGETDFGHPVFTIKNEIPQIGTDGDGANSYDMLMIVEGLQEAMCNVINDRAKGDRTINTADDVETKYDGVINTTGTYSFPATFNGQRQECFRDNAGGDSGALTYYYVLVIR